MSFLAYPLALEAGEFLAYWWAGFAVAAPIVGLAITEQGIGDFSHPDVKVPHVHGRDITAVPTSDPGDGGAMDFHYVFESPLVSPDIDMNGVPHKRPTSPIETPKIKIRVKDRLKERSRNGSEVLYIGPSYTAGYCRDFSGVQRTRVNPVTGRIIGYKGIPRKRSLSPTSKYSSFWRDQKHAKTSFHAARSPGVWDSARR